MCSLGAGALAFGRDHAVVGAGIALPWLALGRHWRVTLLAVSVRVCKLYAVPWRRCGWPCPKRTRDYLTLSLGRDLSFQSDRRNRFISWGGPGLTGGLRMDTKRQISHVENYNWAVNENRLTRRRLPRCGVNRIQICRFSGGVGTNR